MARAPLAAVAAGTAHCPCCRAPAAGWAVLLRGVVSFPADHPRSSAAAQVAGDRLDPASAAAFGGEEGATSAADAVSADGLTGCLVLGWAFFLMGEGCFLENLKHSIMFLSINLLHIDQYIVKI